jgi:hypothetical protein
MYAKAPKTRVSKAVASFINIRCVLLNKISLIPLVVNIIMTPVGIKFNPAHEVGVEEKLRRISPGLYRDMEGTLYLNWSEFLAAHSLPGSAEVRQAVREQIKREFGGESLKELD